MQLALKVPGSAFRDLRTIITYTGYDENKATELALELAFSLYRLAVHYGVSEVTIPLAQKRGYVYRVPLFPRPKRRDEEDTENRSPLRVNISANAHGCLKAISKHYNLSDEVTLWLSLQLVAEMLHGMDRAKSHSYVVQLKDGRRLRGDIETPPKLT